MRSILWKMSLIMVIFLQASVPPVAAQSDETNAFIDKVIEAYGGKEQVLSIRTYRLEATIQAYTRGGEGTVVRIVEGLSRLKVFIRYPSVIEIRVFDENAGWRGSSPQTLTAVSGPMRDSMVLQAARANMPWILDKMRPLVRLVWTEDALPVLELPLGEGLLLKAFLDAQTYRVMRTETVVTVQSMEIQFQTQYSDFRMIDGVLFPFHEENYAGGTHTASTTIDRIQINPDEGRLKLPEE